MRVHPIATSAKQPEPSQPSRQNTSTTLDGWRASPSGAQRLWVLDWTRWLCAGCLSRTPHTTPA